MSTERVMPNWSFRGMAVLLRFMERFRKPATRLTEVGLKSGQTVLEYGIGAGSYTIPAARMLGEAGHLYAVDIHPLAIETVEKRLWKEDLTNVTLILSDRDTGLPDESVDVVLLYDTLHLVQDKQALLAELHRVLKPDGLLSADHEHTNPDALVQTVTAGKRFVLRSKNGHVFGFGKA
jgi:ubiquinone/menaquinone biosynthesis C-methylase UbiE